MGTYTVNASRDGKFWFLHIVELDQYTQARNLTEIEQMARDLVCLHTEESMDSIELNTVIILPEEVTTAREEAQRLRSLAERSNTEAAAKSREAAQLLRSEGVTVRDLGKILGVSYQRAQQLSAMKQTRQRP